MKYLIYSVMYDVVKADAKSGQSLQSHWHQSIKQSHANRSLIKNERFLMTLYMMLLQRKWRENKSGSYYHWHEKRGYNNLKCLLLHRGAGHLTKSYLSFLYIKIEISYIFSHVWLCKIDNKVRLEHIVKLPSTK